MRGKIKIAILWHMHQPLYRNPYTRKFELPWVRLHGLKDYYGMVALLEDFPGVKATYNLVPSLLTQLQSYCRGEKDLFQDVFSKEAQALEAEEIHFLVRHFFSANPRHSINPWPGYRHLFEKKNHYKNSGHTPWEKVFKVDELRDLQVWFQLSYFDDRYKREDTALSELYTKGEHFSEEDKKTIEQAESKLLAMIIPAYKKLSDSGQIELSTTPFYHPILPLLLDPQIGRVANPNLPEYDLHFNWEEDAAFHLEAALDYMEQTFTKRPVGIWPSEGSLSMATLQLLAKAGIQWTATDEINLSHSLGEPIERDHQFIPKNPGVLYKPYRLKDNAIETKIFFRDRHLSDLIGFHYQEKPYQKAAADLVSRIKQSADRVTGSHDVIVPIILDGENAWEFYPNNGRDFLREFYRLIEEDKSLETVTFSEALQADIKPGIIEHLSPGSWVNGNFDIWIGDEEDRRAWGLLVKAKSAFEKTDNSTPLSPEKKKETRKYLAIAQGSDWYWWYGKENYTPDLYIFDNLFRKNLQKVYELLGQEAPEEFSLPIPRGARPESITIIPPTRALRPRIDGRVGSYFEWLCAGCIDIGSSGGAMNIANPLVNKIYYGFDKRFLYIRVDTKGHAYSFLEEGYVLNIVIKNDGTSRRLPIDHTKNVYETDERPSEITTAVDDIIEVAIPMETLHLKEGGFFYMQLEWKYNGDYFQVLPPHDFFRISVPKDKDYACYWQV